MKPERDTAAATSTKDSPLAICWWKPWPDKRAAPGAH